MDKFSKALEHLKKKELAPARVILEQLVREEPNRGEALYNLGMIYTDMGEPEKAVGTLSKLLAFEECGANVYVALGFAYSRMKDHDQAKKMFLIALKIEPDNPYAHKNIGALYGNEKNYEKAIRHFEEAFKANPEDSNTAYGLGVTYFNTGNVIKADHYLRKTIELEPASSLSEMAKDLLREIAVLNLKGKGFRTDAMFYCLHAISLFEKVGPAETQKIAFEIALKGREGLDINDSFKKYTLDSLPGVFSGLELVSYMYVGFKLTAPEQDIGLDLSEEFEMALNFSKIKGSHEYTIH